MRSNVCMQCLRDRSNIGATERGLGLQEFEPTGNKMDLRYISDDTEFGDRTARDEADSVPSDYSPPDLNKHSLQVRQDFCRWLPVMIPSWRVPRATGADGSNCAVCLGGFDF